MTAVSTAFVFPGQGSQRVGMGRELLEQRPGLSHYYRVADDLLGFPLSKACFEGPAEDLLRTEITQPAVFLTSIVTLDVLREHGISPAAVAGHSLGEYTALVAAGVLDWTDALRLVRRRGLLMASANAVSAGGMAAVLGLDLPRVAELCAHVEAEWGHPVEVANDNDPGQVVVSGAKSAVAEVATLARAAGADRVVGLEVGAAFHSRLMRPIEDAFVADLDAVSFRDPQLPLIANTTARFVRTGEEAKQCLRRQLAGTVRWTETLRLLAAHGTTRFVEVGPGRVLSGFCRTTCPGIPVHATSDGRRLRQTLSALTTPVDAEAVA